MAEKWGGGSGDDLSQQTVLIKIALGNSHPVKSSGKFSWGAGSLQDLEVLPQNARNLKRE